MSKGILCMMVLVLAACSTAPQPQAQPTGVMLPTDLPTVASVTTYDEAKLVPIESIEDSRIRNWATLSNPSATDVVEVAPGVYAARGQTESLDPSLYRSVFGLCSDVTLYQKLHGVGGTCW